MSKKIDINTNPPPDLAPQENQKEDPMNQKSPRNWLDITITIILVLIIIGLLVWIFWPSQPRTFTLSPSALEGSTTTALTSETASSTTTTSSIDKSAIVIKILNGNQRTGEAAALKDKMEKDGFKIASVGNAKSIYQTTIIYYKTGKQSQAQLVKDFIGTSYQTSLEENSELVGTADVLIVLGLK